MARKPHPRRRDTSTTNGEPDSDYRVTEFYHDHRGQTLFDFLVGITLFLAVIAFTVVFVPDLIDPFEPSQDASTILADRGADHLTQNVMRAEGEGPYILDDECTVALFSGNAASACDVSNNELGAIVGMNPDSNVHVAITNADEDIITVDGVHMEYGDPVDESTSDVYTATRIVTLNNQRYTLTYNVW